MSELQLRFAWDSIAEKTIQLFEELYEE